MKILGVIPARYESVRFPGKPLADIWGKPMIQRVYEQCVKTKMLSKVIVATDDQRIYETVNSFGNVLMTSEKHLNGTSRCSEVLELLPDADEYDYLINIQGDEPLIHPEQIDELADLFKDKTAQIVTQAKKEYDPELLQNRNIVKVITDEIGFAIDFNREPSPVTNDDSFFKHIGIYGFKTDILKEIIQLASTQNEIDRKLEQLRWLDYGYLIKVGITEYESISVDLPSDITKILPLLAER